MSAYILKKIVVKVSGSDLCFEPSCQCTPNEALPDLTDVTCNCFEKQVKLIMPQKRARVNLGFYPGEDRTGP